MTAYRPSPALLRARYAIRRRNNRLGATVLWTAFLAAHVALAYWLWPWLMPGVFPWE